MNFYVFLNECYYRNVQECHLQQISATEKIFLVMNSDFNPKIVTFFFVEFCRRKSKKKKIWWPQSSSTPIRSLSKNIFVFTVSSFIVTLIYGLWISASVESFKF